MRAEFIQEVSQRSMLNDCGRGLHEILQAESSLSGNAGQAGHGDNAQGIIRGRIAHGQPGKPGA